MSVMQPPRLLAPVPDVNVIKLIIRHVRGVRVNVVNVPVHGPWAGLSPRPLIFTFHCWSMFGRHTTVHILIRTVLTLGTGPPDPHKVVNS